MSVGTEQAPEMLVAEDEQHLAEQQIIDTEHVASQEQLPGESFWERHADTPMTYMGITAPPSVLIKLCPKDLSKMTNDDLSRFTAKIASKDPNFEMEEKDLHLLEPKPKPEKEMAGKADSHNTDVIENKKNTEKPSKSETTNVDAPKPEAIEPVTDIRDAQLAVVVENSELLRAAIQERASALSKQLIARVEFMHQNNIELVASEAPKPSYEKPHLGPIPNEVVASDKIIAAKFEAVEDDRPTKEAREYQSSVTPPVYEAVSLIETLEQEPLLIMQSLPAPIDVDVERAFDAIHDGTETEPSLSNDAIEQEVASLGTELHNNGTESIDKDKFETAPAEDEADKIVARLGEWTADDIIALTASVHHEGEAPELVYEVRSGQDHNVEQQLFIPESPTDQIVSKIEHVLVLQEDQIEKTETFVATMPEGVQEKLVGLLVVDESVERTLEEAEKAERVTQMTVRIAEVADRLHVLYQEDRLDTKEAAMIEKVLISQYMELLETLEAAVEDDTIQNFINLIRSEAYSHDAVQVAKIDYQQKWEKDHWAAIASDQDQDEGLLRRWLNAGKEVVKNNVVLAL